PFVLYEILLWILFKQPFASRAAEIECTTIVNAAMPGSGRFNYHTTYRINSSIDTSILSILSFTSQGTNKCAASRFMSFDLYQLSKNARCNLFGRNSSDVKASRYPEVCYLLFGQTGSSQVGTAIICTTTTAHHTHIRCRATQCLL